MRKYGIIPEFKAGINTGEVTVAEVGETKKELAYHGDVLDTTARIQSKCNDFQKRLLISETMKTHLQSQKGFRFEFLDCVQLRCKKKSISIYSVESAAMTGFANSS